MTTEPEPKNNFICRNCGRKFMASEGATLEGFKCPSCGSKWYINHINKKKEHKQDE